MLNWVGADRWWFGALNLYLPQIVWAAPGVLLTVLSLKAARRWVWAPLLCVAWVLGPIMGFCWGTQGPPGSAGDPPMRIMTWNVKDGGHNKITQLAITGDIDEVGYCDRTVRERKPSVYYKKEIRCTDVLSCLDYNSWLDRSASHPPLP